METRGTNARPFRSWSAQVLSYIFLIFVCVAEASAGELPTLLQLMDEAFATCKELKVESDEEPTWSLGILAQAQVYAGDYSGALKTVSKFDPGHRVITLLICAMRQAELTGIPPIPPTGIGEAADLLQADYAKFYTGRGQITQALQTAGGIPVNRGTLSFVADTYLDIAVAQLQRGDRCGTLATLRQARSLVGKMPWRPRAVEKLVRMIELFKLAGDPTSACNAAWAAEQLAETEAKQGDINEFTMLMWARVGKGHVLVGNQKAAARAFHRAFDYAVGLYKDSDPEVVGDNWIRGQRCTAYAKLGSIHYSVGWKDHSARSFQQALKEASGIKIASTRDGNLHDIFSSQVEAGDFQGAHSTMSKIKTRFYRSHCLCKLAETNRASGQTDAARKYIEQARKLGEAEKDANDRTAIFVDIGKAQAAYRDLIAARESFQLALDVSNATKGKEYHQRVALAQIRVGLLSEAYETVKKIEELEWRVLPLARLVHELAKQSRKNQEYRQRRQ